jgi:hypothetical protein
MIAMKSLSCGVIESGLFQPQKFLRDALTGMFGENFHRTPRLVTGENFFASFLNRWLEGLDFFFFGVDKTGKRLHMPSVEDELIAENRRGRVKTLQKRRVGSRVGRFKEGAFPAERFFFVQDDSQLLLRPVLLNLAHMKKTFSTL